MLVRILLYSLFTNLYFYCIGVGVAPFKKIGESAIVIDADNGGYNSDGPVLHGNSDGQFLVKKKKRIRKKIEDVSAGADAAAVDGVDSGNRKRRVPLRKRVYDETSGDFSYNLLHTPFFQ